MDLRNKKGEILFRVPDDWSPIFADPDLLAGANLTDGQLRGVDLGNADLSNACLAGADLYMAFLNSIKLSGANLEGACLARSRH